MKNTHRKRKKKKNKLISTHVCLNQLHCIFRWLTEMITSYRRETALQGKLVLAKSGRLKQYWETIVYGHYRSIFNHCDIIDLQNSVKKQNKAYYAVQGHSRSSMLVSIESSYATSD